MQALINLHDELVALNGYEVEVCAALHQWSEFLKNARKRAKNRNKTPRMFFGRGNPNDPSAKFQHVKSFDDLIHASRKNGININTHRRSVVILIHAIWEDQYRQRIAYECELPNKNSIESDVFHDVNKYRQAVLHAGGRLVGEPKVIRLFKPGEEVLLTDEHMYQLFSILVSELNRIGKTYYGQEPGFSLDKPLNNPSSNKQQR